MVEGNAPGHKGQANIYRQINQLDVIPWPAQSPYLNSIEALWWEMETELGKTVGRVAEPEVLKIKLKNALKNIGIDRLYNLIRCMLRRLEAVIAAGGRATRYKI